LQRRLQGRLQGKTRGKIRRGVRGNSVTTMHLDLLHIGLFGFLLSLVCHAAQSCLMNVFVVRASIEDRSKTSSRCHLCGKASMSAPARILSHTAVRLGVFMNITLSLGPVVSLIAGILILVMPRLLNYIVALYLIIIGVIGIFGVGASHF
jgi:hypothetical protein